jgi:hypothetical protein
VFSVESDTSESKPLSFLAVLPRWFISLLCAAVGLAFGSGGTVALARDKVEKHSAEISQLKSETKQDHDDITRLKSDVAHTRETVDRIWDHLNSPR